MDQETDVQDKSEAGRLGVTIEGEQHVRVTCPTCDAAFKVYARQMGKFVRCPSCAGSFYVENDNGKPESGPALAKKRPLALAIALAATTALLVGFAAGYSVGIAHARAQVLEIYLEQELEPTPAEAEQPPPA